MITKMGETGVLEEGFLKHQKLVYSLARKYSFGSQEQYDENVQNGSLGLIYALEKFNPERKLKFSTYGYRCVSGYILRGIKNFNPNHCIKIPLHLYSKKYAKELEKYKQIQITSQNFDCDSNNWAAQLFTDDRYLYSSDEHQELWKHMDCLAEREKFVLWNYCVEEEILRKIGEHLGITRARVGAIKDVALGKMKRQILTARASRGEL